MICPNCGSNMSEKRKRCERCGGDLTLYKKIMKASNLYYNNGLARAKVRDLSGAVNALRNSLKLNKKNTEARNLLGLIYFEMGETVAALSEWVISKHFNAVDNVADDYINAVQSNPTKLDTLNQAIKRYNNALTSAKQGSDDLAIIQLKKVTSSLNPHFIRAYQLLALLYIKNGENDKAKKCLLKVGKIDVSNTTTLRYMQELEPNASLLKDYNAGSETTHMKPTSIMPISSYKEDKPNIMAYVNLVIGAIVGVAVTAFLIVPSIKNNYTAQENSYYARYGEILSAQEEKEKAYVALQQDYKELEGVVSQLRIQIDTMEEPGDNLDRYDPLFETIEYYLNEMSKANSKDREYIELAEALAVINENQYEAEASKRLISRLKVEVFPEAAKLIYSSGHKFYSEYKYEEAIVELEKAIAYDPSHVDAVYYTARSYHRLNDNESAILYYNIVITDFPDTRRARQSADFIKQVQVQNVE